MHPPRTPSDNACLIDPPAFIERFREAARERHFRSETFGEIAGVALAAFTKRTPGPRPRIYLSAGIHGDEPAPPLALLELMQRGAFDHRANWFVCPLLNPAGFIGRTRENAEGLDLNRDYKALRSAEIRSHARWLQRQPNFDVTLQVHEDWEAQGFYLYELCSANHRSLARPMIEAVERMFPIETATVIDGRPVDERGIIRPLADPLQRDPWPESIYLRAHHSQRSYTIETPSGLPLASRVDALATAIRTAIQIACEHSR